MQSNKYQIINLNRIKILRQRKTRLTRIVGFLDKKFKIFPWYIKKFDEIIKKHFKNKPISILGLGMGIAMISHLNKNYKITYVEPNKEIIQIAKKEFFLPKNTKIKTTTAKRYLDQKNNEKYDIIFYDIFIQNKMYWKCLNEKYIKKMKNQLKKEGLLIINIAAKKKDIKEKLNFSKHKIIPRHKNPIYKKISQNYIVIIKK